jgi:RND superfamily putative drug exporter
VVTGKDLTGSAMRDAIGQLQARAASAGPASPIHGPVTARPVAGGHALIVGVPLAGTGGNSVSNSALLTLRSQILPATLGKVSGVRYAVAGDTAQSYDDTAALHRSTPVVFAFVILLAFALLLVAFRSVTIPLVSVGLNLVSVGAGYGLQGLLGYTSFGAIVSWVPLFMFVLLFGLSNGLSQRRGSHQRGRHHGRGVLHPGDAADRGHQDPWYRPGRRGAHGRHRCPGHPASRDHVRARRKVLVPAPLARLAARPPPRRRVTERPHA